MITFTKKYVEVRLKLKQKMKRREETKDLQIFEYLEIAVFTYFRFVELLVAPSIFGYSFNI